MKQANLKGMFKKASKSVSTATAVVISDPLSPRPSATSAMQKTYKMTLNQQRKEIYIWNIPLVSCTALV